jgi:hypothetical protein
MEREIPIDIGTAFCLGSKFTAKNGAGDGIRTRDFLLGKQTFYH